MVKTATLAAAAAAVTAVPRLCLACPSCAANPDGGVTRYLLIGLMILAPYVASMVVIRLIRKGEAAMRASEGVRAKALD